jgi:hypothetical protein
MRSTWCLVLLSHVGVVARLQGGGSGEMIATSHSANHSAPALLVTGSDLFAPAAVASVISRPRINAACVPGKFKACSDFHCRCAACPAGKYSDRFNRHTCSGCAPGTYQPDGDRKACKNKHTCDAGSYRSCDDKQWTCECLKCAIGKFSSLKDNSTSCGTCAQGKIQPKGERKFCIDAKSYFLAMKSMPTVSPTAEPTQYPTKAYMANGDTEESEGLLCGLGKYGRKTAWSGVNFKCELCPRGKYTRKTNAWQCDDCPKGRTHAPGESAAWCRKIDADDIKEEEFEGKRAIPVRAAVTVPPTPKPTPAPPTPYPTRNPTPAPTSFPSVAPTAAPTAYPTAAPTASPTVDPTASPTPSPTLSPTPSPTASPTPAPTYAPTPQLWSKASGCSAGKYGREWEHSQGDNHQNTCMPCPIGKFQGQPDKWLCYKCHPGQYTKGAKALACVPLPSGRQHQPLNPTLKRTTDDVHAASPTDDEEEDEEAPLQRLCEFCT